jgi:hypothetical protein
MTPARATRTEPGTAVPPQIVSLVAELLDAQLDTLEFGSELSAELRWAAHLDYVRALRRRGTELLAALDSEAASR